jgi:hypothetical protein
MEAGSVGDPVDQLRDHEKPPAAALPWRGAGGPFAARRIVGAAGQSLAWLSWAICFFTAATTSWRL